MSADTATTIVRDPGVSIATSGGQVLVDELHDLQTAGAAPGDPFSVTLNVGVPGPVPFAVWVALPGRPILHPQSLWLDLTAPAQLFAGSVTGARTDSAVVPAAFPIGFPIAMQAVLLVEGQLEMSTPVVLVLY